MEVTMKEAQKIFEEWDRRFRENPEDFVNFATALLKETPETYGDAVGPYFFELLGQLREGR